MDLEYPLYGKRGNPPISPEQWWTELIRRCVKEAGADQAGEPHLSLYFMTCPSNSDATSLPL
jgi:hypothetical protein